MRPARVAIAVAVLMLAACAGGLVDRAGPPRDGADAEEAGGAEEAEPVDPGDVAPDRDLFGLRFEGLWRFARPTEVVLVLHPDAAVADLAGELGTRAGLVAVEELDAAVVEDRADLEALLPPGAPVPAVLLVTAADHATALSLDAFGRRREVHHVLLPTCDALAGSARWHGAEQARTLLDAAGCRQIVIVAANPDVETPWVAAAGIEAGAVCIAAAYQDGPLATSSATCSRRPGHPGLPVAVLSGGFVVGFAPPGAVAVALEVGDRTATVEPVTVADGAARAYAAYLPEPGTADTPVGARDVADITWRFLDADGTVIDQG